MKTVSGYNNITPTADTEYLVETPGGVTGNVSQAVLDSRYTPSSHEGAYPHGNIPTNSQAASFPPDIGADNPLVADDDTRLTDARTPTAHAASHAAGQGDVITPGAIGAATEGHDHTGTYEPANANIQAHVSSPHAPTSADNTAANETSHTDVVVDGDFTADGILKRTAQGVYGIQPDNSASWDVAHAHSQAGHAPTSADNTAANETSHADVVVDGDFTADGLLKRTAQGVYGIQPDNSVSWDVAYAHSQAGHALADAQKNSDITKAEIEAKLIGEVGTHSHPESTPEQIGAEPALGTPAEDGQALLGNLDGTRYWGQVATGGGSANFHKPDPDSPAFTKTSATTLSVKAGVKVLLADETVIAFDTTTAILLPTLAAGTDYAIWCRPDGTPEATTDFASPPAAGSRLIGGFHYGLIAPTETVVGGSFATSGNGMIWTQADVDRIRGINEFSLWDLKWRTTSSDLRAQRGFVYVKEANCWMALYFAGTGTDTDGLSAAGTNICSGTVAPKIPAAYGGNGSAVYASPDWYSSAEMAAAYGARLPWLYEFQAMAFGVTEGQSIGGAAATYPTTQRNPGYTSRYGAEQATGHHLAWGLDTSYRYDGATWAWKNATGGRGNIYTQGTYGLVCARLGGTRADATDSGSRCVYWGSSPWGSVWGSGFRAACDHLKLV
jgi:hypothetical protein